MVNFLWFMVYAVKLIINHLKITIILETTRDTILYRGFVKMI